MRILAFLLDKLGTLVTRSTIGLIRSWLNGMVPAPDPVLPPCPTAMVAGVIILTALAVLSPTEQQPQTSCLGLMLAMRYLLRWTFISELISRRYIPTTL